ncbi:sensor histidine kinase [Leifsonia poae]|uniref:sensor histidine kinase n=1 Tax=Leifsonia poae TaxID=110933 RepID=UPI001CC07242|nr:histidine kinase [Leifsonia poae]
MSSLPSAPERAGQPRQRLDRMLVLLSGVGGTAAVAVLALTAALGATIYGIPVVIALTLGVAQAGAILLAVFAPRYGMALSVIAVAGFAVASTPDGANPWPVPVTALIAQAVVILFATLRSDWRTGLVGWGAGVAAGIVVALIVVNRSDSGVTPGAATADLIVFASITGIVLVAAVLVTQWQAVRRQLQREQQVSASELARREIAEERTRIARELHDVVAHGMSAIQVQASSARYRIPSLSEEAAAEFDDLAATARGAMGEMRRLLGVLRSEDTVVETAPQPGVTDVPGLVERARRAGAVVTLDDRVSPAETATLDPALSLTVYRIVQESLSNVARHATGAGTLVLLATADGALDVEVRNEASTGRPASAPAPDTGGHGIRGMRERTALLGGSLDAGRTDDGGFAVRASFPLRPPKGAA